MTLGAGDADAMLAYHWREAGHPDRAIQHLMAAAEIAGRGWAKARAANLYAQALELVPEDDVDLKRDLVRKRAVAAAAAMHIADAEALRGRQRDAGAAG